MAEPLPPLPKIDELFLPPEVERYLKDMEPAIQTMKKNIEKCKKAGLDVARVEEDFKKSLELREGALRELTK